MTAPRIIDEGKALLLTFDGVPRRFHAIWLRDNARDPATRSPGNGQRLITLADIPATTRLTSAEWVDEHLRLGFAPEAILLDFDADWLAAHAYDRSHPGGAGWLPTTVAPWTGAAAAEVPVEDWAEVCTDDLALRRWLASVRRHGFARLSGVPTSPGTVCAVAERFGYVRETNYGRYFDVRAKVDPDNLAYTNLGLEAHTDNPYRDPVPGLQLLACLANAVEGGGSVLVDGFAVAQRLRDEDPAAFASLSNHCARFEYAGGSGVCLRSRRPMIECAPDGELVAIRYNNRSAAALTDIPYDSMEAYYRAYRRFGALIADPDYALRFRLAPGDLFVVDNTRVLHARDAFTGGGERWLQGCYVDRDGLLSTLAVLEAGLTASGA